MGAVVNGKNRKWAGIYVSEAPELHPMTMTAIEVADDWFASLLHLQGAVWNVIYARVLLVLMVTMILVVLDSGLEVKVPTVSTTAHTFIGLAMGLLLVFRTNSAYDRFWECRKAWGTILSSARNFSRILAQQESRTVVTGEHVGAIFIAFAESFKLKLRRTDDYAVLGSLLKPGTLDLAVRCSNMPCLMLYLLTLYFEKLVDIRAISISTRVELEKMLNCLSAAVSECERLLDTPLPLPYLVQIRQMLMLYLLTLPLVLYAKFSLYFEIPVIIFLSFGFFGIEEAGNLIQNPFGTEFCDLPLDTYIGVMRSEIESTFAFSRQLRNQKCVA